MPDNPSSPSSTVLTLLFVFVIYLAINLACVFLPFIPGMGIFFFWGIIFPLLMCLINIIYLISSELRGNNFWIPVILFPFSYLSLGVLTFFYVAALYASI